VCGPTWGASCGRHPTTPARVRKPHYPAYYLPLGDVVADLTDTASGTTHRAEATRPVSTWWPARSGPGAALHYGDSPIEALRDAVRIEWDAMDEWLEEDEPVYTHPRSPYSRVDILASSRHVVVELDGHTLADSHQPRILFETGLPPRYYLPLTDLSVELLRPSSTVTHCPYKGSATYWSIELGERSTRTWSGSTDAAA